MFLLSYSEAEMQKCSLNMQALSYFRELGRIPRTFLLLHKAVEDFFIMFHSSSSSGIGCNSYSVPLHFQ